MMRMELMVEVAAKALRDAADHALPIGPQQDGTYFYDDAWCDLHCIADDLEAALTDMEDEA